MAIHLIKGSIITTIDTASFDGTALSVINVDGKCIWSGTGYFTFPLLDDGTYSVKATSGFDLPEYLVIPGLFKGVTISTIANSGFADKTEVKGCVVGDGITTVGQYAFRCEGSNSQLEYIVLPTTLTLISHAAFTNCVALKNVFYKGSSAQWEEINFDTIGNGYLVSAKRYYYRETQPVGQGKYWHYVDGKPTIWENLCEEGHTYECVRVEPTCTEKGRATYTCSECGDVYIEVLDALGHTWSEWEDVHPAECEVPGMRERKCTVCGHAETEIIPALGHNYDSGGRIIEPTCTTGGYTLHTCVDCGHTYKDNFTEPNDAHTPSPWIYDPAPTETKEGARRKECLACGEILTFEYLPTTYALPPSYCVFSFNRDGDYQVAVDPESVEYLSSRVGLPIRDGKTTGTGTIVTHVAERGFAQCENIKELYIPANYVCIDDDAFAYCTNLRKVVFDSECEISIIGRGAFSHCTSLTECILPSKTKYVHEDAFYNTPLLTRVEVPITVETMGSRVFAAAPNLTVYCEAESKPEAWADDWVDDTVTVVWGSKCNYDEHDFVEVVTPPTCTEGGYSTYTCSKCGANYIGDPVEALGHSSSDWIIDTEATGTTEGSKHKECTRCGEILETATIPKVENADEYLTYTLLNSGEGYSVKATDVSNLPDELTIPSTYNGKPVLTIENEAFYDGSQNPGVSATFTKVILPDSIKSIGMDAFHYCREIKEINIPIGVEYIAESAFYECTNLTIYCEAESQPDAWDENWNYSNCPVVWGNSATTYLTDENGNVLTDENDNLITI